MRVRIGWEGDRRKGLPHIVACTCVRTTMPTHAAGVQAVTRDGRAIRYAGYEMKNNLQVVLKARAAPVCSKQ